MSSITSPTSLAPDDYSVQSAGFALLFYGILNIAISALLLSTGIELGTGGAPSDALIYGSIVYGIANLVLGWRTLDNSYTALLIGFVLVLANLLVAVLLFHYLQVLLSAVVAIYINQGRMALEATNARVDHPAQTDSLTSYYHHLIPILVHVMTADGHTDRRERRKLLRALDGMKISRYEQNRLVENAARNQDLAVHAYVSAYLTAAKNAGLEHPEHQLMLSALAVASADGILVSEEATAILSIASAAGIPTGEAEALVSQERDRLESLDLSTARALLGVAEDAPKEAIDVAYRGLTAEFDSDAYDHLGERVVDYASERKLVIDRAYQQLLERFQESHVA